MAKFFYCRVEHSVLILFKKKTMTTETVFSLWYLCCEPLRSANQEINRLFSVAPKRTNHSLYKNSERFGVFRDVVC